MRSIIFRISWFWCVTFVRNEWIMKRASERKIMIVIRHPKEIIAWNRLRLIFLHSILLCFWIRNIKKYKNFPKPLRFFSIDSWTVWEIMKRRWQLLAFRMFPIQLFGEWFALCFGCLRSCKQLVGSMVIKAVIIMMKNVYGWKYICHGRAGKVSTAALTWMPIAMKKRHWAEYFSW